MSSIQDLGMILSVYTEAFTKAAQKNDLEYDDAVRLLNTCGADPVSITGEYLISSQGFDEAVEGLAERIGQMKEAITTAKNIMEERDA